MNTKKGETKMKREMSKMFLACVLVLVATSCGTERRPDEEKVIKNIVRVFRGDGYTFFVQDPGQKEVKELRVYDAKDMKVFTDVPAGQSVWARIICRSYQSKFLWIYTINRSSYYLVELHLHSVADVGGIGYRYNCGKSCSREVNMEVVE